MHGIVQCNEIVNSKGLDQQCTINKVKICSLTLTFAMVKTN